METPKHDEKNPTIEELHADASDYIATVAEKVNAEAFRELKEKIVSRIREEAAAGIDLVENAEELSAAMIASISRVITHPDFASMNLIKAQDTLTKRMYDAYREALEQKMVAAGKDEAAQNRYARLLIALDSIG